MSVDKMSMVDETVVLLQLCLDTLDLITFEMPKYINSKDSSSFCKLDKDCVSFYESIQEKSRETQLLPNQKQILYSHIINCLTMHCNTNKLMQYIEKEDGQEDIYDINPKFVSNYNFMFYTLLGYLDKQIFENKLLNMLREAIKSIKIKMICAGSSNKTSYEDLYAPIQRVILKSTNCN